MQLQDKITEIDKHADSAQGKLSALATRPVGQLLWEYSLPAVTGMVVVSLYNVIDRIFIGRGVGADAISGLAITFPVMNLATALGVLIGVGGSARISIMLGAKRMADAQHILGNALTLTVSIALVYVAVFGIFMEDILRAFGASDRTLPYAYDFMMWLLPGLLLTNLTYSFNNIQRASGYPRRAMITMILSALSNLIFAPIFIFGLDMGIKGAALATDLAMAGAMVFVMWHFIDRRSTLHFTAGTFTLRWPVVLSIISIGAAPALVNAASCLINFLINSELVKNGGDVAVGAAGIFSTYAQLIVMVVLGICQGMQPIVGYNYGAGHLERLRKAFFLAAGVSTLLCLMGFSGAFLMPEIIAGIFTTDTTLISVTEHGLSIAMLAFALVGLQIVSTNFFQSIGQVGKSIFLGLTRQVIFLIPLLLWLPGHFGIDGVWMSFPISDTFATIVTLAMITYQLKHLAPSRH